MTRTAEEIAQGLDAPRPGRPIPAGERVHVLGIGGAAAASAALLAHAAGARVDGCDTGGPSPYTPELDAAGIAIAGGHDANHVVEGSRPTVEVCAVTKAITAVAPDLPELRAAAAAGIPLVSCQQLIADAAATRGLRTIGIAGTHGKSTTSGWVTHLLAEAGRDPTAFVGALMPAGLTGGTASTVRLGAGRDFVVEADEYAGNFDPYRPAIGVLLNADWDHPDVFADRAAVVKTFARWVGRFDGGGEDPVLAVDVGDPGAAEVADRLEAWDGRLIAFRVVSAEAPAPGSDTGAHAGAAAGDPDPSVLLSALASRHRTARGPALPLVGRLRIDAAGMSRLLVHGLPGNAPVEAALRLVGRHYADDALGAAAAGLAAGLTADEISRGLASFPGVGRRFEMKGDVDGVVVIDDYGHHPTAIAATLDGARLRYPGRRLWAVYEPLTYHRTAMMIEEFADVLATADRVAIAQVFAVRDPDTTITSAAALAAAVNVRGRAPAVAPGTVEETADAILTALEPGDVVLVMGGGRSYVLAERLVAGLRRRRRDAAG
ncbi:MAG: Mur ligase domain-containing protein [Chloroflexi bacterium]|nr:Mur ligase domain-containing protein [Chloroflexota bacterium]